MENLADSGRRVICEIVLARGIKAAPGGLIADTVPLVQHAIADDGSSVWTALAQVVDGALRWSDGDAEVPAQLRHKLRRARLMRPQRAAAPTLDGAGSAIERAASFLASGSGHRALEALRGAWAERNDPRVLEMAHRAVSSIGGASAREWAERNADLLGQLTAAVERSRWTIAAETLERILGQLEIAAVIVPPAGWDSFARQITAAQATQRTVEEALAEARAMIGSGGGRAALTRLDGLSAGLHLLEPPLQCAALEVRVAALRALVASGDGSRFALEAAEARLSGLRAIADAERDERAGGRA